MNLFKKVLSLFLAVLVLLGTVPLISLPAYAADGDNASTGGYGDGNYNGGWYDARNSMPGAFWKASVYVRLNDNNSTNNTTRLDNPRQWQKLGKSVYIHWNETYFKTLLKGNVLFTQSNKVEYLKDSSTPGGNTRFDDADNYTTSPTYLIDTNAKPVPGLYDGNPKTQLNAVKSYFGDTDTLTKIIKSATNKDSVMGAIGNINFTLDGVTMKGNQWQTSGRIDYAHGATVRLEPGAYGTSGNTSRNGVAYTVVYEPVIVVNLKQGTSYNGAGGFSGYRKLAFTPTELAIAQAKGKLNMKRAGQNMNNAYRLSFPSSVYLENSWFGYTSWNKFTGGYDDTGTSDQNIYSYGGWGMRYLGRYDYVMQDFSASVVAPKITVTSKDVTVSFYLHKNSTTVKSTDTIYWVDYRVKGTSAWTRAVTSEVDKDGSFNTNKTVKISISHKFTLPDANKTYEVRAYVNPTYAAYETNPNNNTATMEVEVKGFAKVYPSVTINISDPEGIGSGIAGKEFEVYCVAQRHNATTLWAYEGDYTNDSLKPDNLGYLGTITTNESGIGILDLTNYPYLVPDTVSFGGVTASGLHGTYKQYLEDQTGHLGGRNINRIFWSRFGHNDTNRNLLNERMADSQNNGTGNKLLLEYLWGFYLGAENDYRGFELVIKPKNLDTDKRYYHMNMAKDVYAARYTNSELTYEGLLFLRLLGSFGLFVDDYKYTKHIAKNNESIDGYFIYHRNLNEEINLVVEGTATGIVVVNVEKGAYHEAVSSLLLGTTYYVKNSNPKGITNTSSKNQHNIALIDSHGDIHWGKVNSSGTCKFNNVKPGNYTVAPIYRGDVNADGITSVGSDLLLDPGTAPEILYDVTGDGEPDLLKSYLYDAKGAYCFETITPSNSDALVDPVLYSNHFFEPFDRTRHENIYTYPDGDKFKVSGSAISDTLLKDKTNTHTFYINKRPNATGTINIQLTRSNSVHGNDSLKGYQFLLEYTNTDGEDRAEVKTTDANGKISIPNLLYKDYTISVLTVQPPYSISGPVEQTVSLKSSSVSLNYTLNATGTLQVNAVKDSSAWEDFNSNMNIEHTTSGLLWTNSTKTDFIANEGSSVSATVDGLSSGTNRFRITDGSVSCHSLSLEGNVDIWSPSATDFKEAWQNGYVITKTATLSSPCEPEFKVKVVSNDPSVSVEGRKVRVYGIKEDGTKFIWNSATTTNSSGVAVISKNMIFNLKGTYVDLIPFVAYGVVVDPVVEVLDGWTDDDNERPYTIISETNTIVSLDTFRNTHSADNRHTQEATITIDAKKGDINVNLKRGESVKSDQDLSDWEFKLYDDNSILKGTASTDSSGKLQFKNVPLGNYTIEPTNTPENKKKFNPSADVSGSGYVKEPLRSVTVSSVSIPATAEFTLEAQGAVKINIEKDPAVWVDVPAGIQVRNVGIKSMHTADETNSVVFTGLNTVNTNYTDYTFDVRDSQMQPLLSSKCAKFEIGGDVYLSDSQRFPTVKVPLKTIKDAPNYGITKTFKLVPACTGTIKVTLTKDSHEALTSIALSGHKFRLYGVSTNNTQTELSEAVTDDNGELSFSDIDIGNSTAYTRFRVVPDELNINYAEFYNKGVFEFTREKMQEHSPTNPHTKNVEYGIRTKEVRGSITVNMRRNPTVKDDESLEGWEFGLYEEDGTTLVKKANTTYNSATQRGTITFSDIDIGKYVIKPTHGSRNKKQINGINSGSLYVSLDSRDVEVSYTDLNVTAIEFALNAIGAIQVNVAKAHNTFGDVPNGIELKLDNAGKVINNGQLCLDGIAIPDAHTLEITNAQLQSLNPCLQWILPSYIDIPAYAIKDAPDYCWKHTFFVENKCITGTINVELTADDALNYNLVNHEFIILETGAKIKTNSAGKLTFTVPIDNSNAPSSFTVLPNGFALPTGATINATTSYKFTLGQMQEHPHEKTVKYRISARTEGDINVELVRSSRVKDDESLEGWEFELYDSTGTNKLRDELFTDADGKVTITNVPIGTYQVKPVHSEINTKKVSTIDPSGFLYILPNTTKNPEVSVVTNPTKSFTLTAQGAVKINIEKDPAVWVNIPTGIQVRNVGRTLMHTADETNSVVFTGVYNTNKGKFDPAINTIGTDYTFDVRDSQMQPLLSSKCAKFEIGGDVYLSDSTGFYTVDVPSRTIIDAPNYGVTKTFRLVPACTGTIKVTLTKDNADVLNDISINEKTFGLYGRKSNDGTLEYLGSAETDANGKVVFSGININNNNTYSGYVVQPSFSGEISGLGTVSVASGYEDEFEVSDFQAEHPHILETEFRISPLTEGTIKVTLQKGTSAWLGNLSGQTIRLFTNPACNGKHVLEKTTDSSGIAIFTDLSLDTAYYLKIMNTAPTCHEWSWENNISEPITLTSYDVLETTAMLTSPCGAVYNIKFTSPTGVPVNNREVHLNGIKNGVKTSKIQTGVTNSSGEISFPLVMNGNAAYDTFEVSLPEYEDTLVDTSSGTTTTLAVLRSKHPHVTNASFVLKPNKGTITVNMRRNPTVKDTEALEDWEFKLYAKNTGKLIDTEVTSYALVDGRELGTLTFKNVPIGEYVVKPTHDFNNKKPVNGPLSGALYVTMAEREVSVTAAKLNVTAIEFALNAEGRVNVTVSKAKEVWETLPTKVRVTHVNHANYYTGEDNRVSIYRPTREEIKIEVNTPTTIKCSKWDVDNFTVEAYALRDAEDYRIDLHSTLIPICKGSIKVEIEKENSPQLDGVSIEGKTVYLYGIKQGGDKLISTGTTSSTGETTFSNIDINNPAEYEGFRVVVDDVGGHVAYIEASPPTSFSMESMRTHSSHDKTVKFIIKPKQLGTINIHVEAGQGVPASVLADWNFSLSSADAFGNSCQGTTNTSGKITFNNLAIAQDIIYSAVSNTTKAGYALVFNSAKSTPMPTAFSENSHVDWYYTVEAVTGAVTVNINKNYTQPTHFADKWIPTGTVKLHVYDQTFTPILEQSVNISGTNTQTAIIPNVPVGKCYIAISNTELSDGYIEVPHAKEITHVPTGSSVDFEATNYIHKLSILYANDQNYYNDNDCAEFEVKIKNANDKGAIKMQQPYTIHNTTPYKAIEKIITVPGGFTYETKQSKPPANFGKDTHVETTAVAVGKDTHDYVKFENGVGVAFFNPLIWDFSIGSVSSPATVQKGDTLTVKLNSVKNNRNFVPSGPVTVALYMDDNTSPIWTKSEAFTANQSKTLTVNINTNSLSAGTHTLRAEINMDGKFYETNYSNNIAYGSFNVTSPDLEIDAVNRSDPYYKGKYVISTFRVYNVNNSNPILPNDKLRVKATIEYTNTAGNVTRNTLYQENIVLPSSIYVANYNLVMFKWQVPEDAETGTSVSITATVNPNNAITESNKDNNKAAITKTVTDSPVSVTPDPGFHLSTPKELGYYNNVNNVLNPVYSNTNNTANWSMWVYENGRLDVKQYSATLTGSVYVKADVRNTTATMSGKNLIMKSGYAVGIAATTKITGVYSGNMITDAQIGYAKYPEFNYSPTTNEYDTLNIIKAGSPYLANSLFVSGVNAPKIPDDIVLGTQTRFELPPTPYSNLPTQMNKHFTPMWYGKDTEDVYYNVRCDLTYMWTPAGVISYSGFARTGTGGGVIIRGSLYDDYYTSRG